jgi:hypothetical protein
MAYVISSSCIGRELPKSCVVADGFPCVEACPVDGIILETGVERPAGPIALERPGNI